MSEERLWPGSERFDPGQPKTQEQWEQNGNAIVLEAGWTGGRPGWMLIRLLLHRGELNVREQMVIATRHVQSRDSITHIRQDHGVRINWLIHRAERQMAALIDSARESA